MCMCVVVKGVVQHHYGNIMNSPSCSGSIVWIISCNRPWRNFAPVCVVLAFPPLLLPVVPAPLLEPGGPERVSEAALDVTDPPGCVAIEVSEELAALPFLRGGRHSGRKRERNREKKEGGKPNMNVKIMNMSIKRTRTHRLGTITHTPQIQLHTRMNMKRTTTQKNSMSNRFR